MCKSAPPYLNISDKGQRDEAWKIKPYPCVGMWGFLKPNIVWSQLDHEYEHILRRVVAGARILDLGCGLGQDLRRLAADGAPTENMFATGAFHSPQLNARTSDCSYGR